MDYKTRMSRLENLKQKQKEQGPALLEQAAEEAYKSYRSLMERLPQEVQEYFNTWEMVKETGLDTELSQEIRLRVHDAARPHREIVVSEHRGMYVFPDGHAELPSGIQDRSLQLYPGYSDIGMFKDVLNRLGNSVHPSVTWTVDRYQALSEDIQHMERLWHSAREEFYEEVDELLELELEEKEEEER